MLQWVLSNLAGLAFTLGGAAIALAVAFFKGRSSGKAAERAKQVKAEQQAFSKIDKSEANVDDNTAEENRKELEQWSDD